VTTFLNTQAAVRATPDRPVDTLPRSIPDMPEFDGELWRDIYYSSFDGLTLYVRHYPAPDEKLRPVICLSGLSRNSREFHTLASSLARHPERPRNVYCFDYRGRGRSQYDRKWRNYTPFVELRDVLDFLTVHGLHKVGIVGTSRGGIISMLMAALRPTAMGPVVLNDIGPVIETRGLARIIGYVGRMPVPKTWPDAVMLLREYNERAFPEFTDAQWEGIARDVFDERKGRPARAYDRRLARALGTIDLSRPVPDLWPQFIALGHIPVFALRGANSDVLSAETLEAMTGRHPNLRAMTVPDQGHAPVLKEPETVETIGAFFAAND
jgi:pimeloyl-ACP methyl ester carboxylesterase